MRQFDQLPAEVQPLRIDVNRVLTGVVLVITALWTWVLFGRGYGLLMVSTLPIAAYLLRRALKAQSSGRLLMWCWLGGAIAGWVNASVGGALVLGIEALPWTLSFGFIGVPYGIAYATSYLLLLAPLRRLAPSTDAAERGLALMVLWAAISVLLLVPAHQYSFPVPIFGGSSQPISTARLLVAVIGVELVALLSAAFLAWRLLRRRRWINAAKLGCLPDFKALEPEPGDETLPWLVAPREPALVIARYVDVGAYRSGEPKPLALVDGLPV